MFTCHEILRQLCAQSDPKGVAGMARFGINPEKALGIRIPVLRAIARKTCKNHSLALQLWKCGIHEARILASMVEEPEKVTDAQIEKWVKDFDSWDVCDQCCMNLFERTPFAYTKCFEWSGRKEEFVKRAAFALMASLAVHDEKRADEDFLKFFPLIEREANDPRNFVKKAVNWSLRQIGKRNRKLNRAATQAAQRISKQTSNSARWIAADALRELQSESLLAKFL